MVYVGAQRQRCGHIDVLPRPEQAGLRREQREHFEQFIEGNVSFGSYFDHVIPWYTASQQSSSILFVRYEELQADLARPYGVSRHSCVSLSTTFS